MVTHRVRTLVISDLHLGSALKRDVLQRPVALDALTAAVARVDRLILLGDTIELLEGRPDEAAAAAEPVLRALAAALPEGAEVVVVPGNHDHALIRSWLATRIDAGRPLRPATQVPKSASELLAELCSWLRPARVEVRYPGVWLAPDVYAMHGHYLDRLLPAALRGRLRSHDGDARSSVDDFERAPGSDAGGTLATLLPDGMGESVEAAVGQARRALLAGLPALATIPGMREAVSLAALVMEQGLHRRAAIPAIDEVARRLRLRARWIVFGHIHRRGPLPGDPPALWRPRGAGRPATAQQRLLGVRQRAHRGAVAPQLRAPLPAGRRGAARARPQPAHDRPAVERAGPGAARTRLIRSRRSRRSRHDRTRPRSPQVPRIGPLELVVVLIIALVVLGPKKLPDAGRALGDGIRQFKGSITGDHDNDRAELPAPAATPATVAVPARDEEPARAA